MVQAPTHPVRPTSPPGSFDADVSRVVGTLRTALATVFYALAKPMRGGTDLQRELGLPSTLSWQLHAFISAPDPTAAASQIPGRQAFKRALAAAGSKGVGQDLLDRATGAFEEFEALVQLHTGSRAAFASMVSSLAKADSSGIDLKARREAFRSARHIYGVQIESLLSCFILHPGATPDRFDYVFINGWIGLQVTRPFEKLFVSRHSSQPDNPRVPLVAPHPVAESIDEGGRPGDVPILSRFSTASLSQFSTEPTGTVQKEVYVSGQPVGRTGALTFFLADKWMGAIPRDEVLQFDSAHLYPTELAVHDVLLAPGVADRLAAPKTGVYGGALHELRKRYRDVDRLNVPAQSAFAGVGVDSLQTSVVPRYVEMLRYVCSRMGWDADGFDTYRCQVEYPVLHTLMNVTFPGPGGARR